MSVSTHAPRAGRDEMDAIVVVQQRLFQPTRPVRGATFRAMPGLKDLDKFQPTRPVRGATYHGNQSQTRSRRFNPRAPCGARPSCWP